MKPNRMLFTTSWDDGYSLDMRIAQLLEERAMRGTFYICPRQQHGAAMLQDGELRELAARFEIGAHSRFHPRLAEVSIPRAKVELAESKALLEDKLSKPCRMFCYPYGSCSPALGRLAEQAGFLGARTTAELALHPGERFLQRTSLHVYPFPVRKKFPRLVQYRNFAAPLFQRYTAWRSLNLPKYSLTGWLPLAIALFEKALQAQTPCFHLWGHSEEVERLQMWHELRYFLDYVAQHPCGVKMVDNSEWTQQIF